MRFFLVLAVVAALPSASSCCCTKMKFTVAGGQDTRGTETECAMLESNLSVRTSAAGYLCAFLLMCHCLVAVLLIAVSRGCAHAVAVARAMGCGEHSDCVFERGWYHSPFPP